MRRALFVLGMVVAATATARAHPVVIDDARLDALRGTLSVGRGYGLFTNAMYGACLKSSRNPGETSYDLDFSLVSLHSQTDLDELEPDGQAFVRKQMEHLARERRPYQAMLARLTVYARVRPLDESSHELVPAMAELIDQGHLSAFVAACGTHYVRSVKRRSSLYVLFTYEGADADVHFEKQVAVALGGFDLDATSSTAEAAAEAAIDAEASKRNLRITAMAIGMQAQPSSVIAFDMASYRKMLDEGFRGTQNDRAGIPDEIEVSPWLSHPTISAALTRSLDRPDGQLYVLRQIVGETGDRYLELLARVADVEGRVVKAAQCRAAVERAYLSDGQLRRELATAYVKSHRLGGSRVLPLTELVRALAPENLARLQTEQEAFAHGFDPAGRPIAPLGRCVEELERSELTVRYQDVVACQQIGEPFSPEAAAIWRVIDEYCFPLIAAPLPLTRAGG